MGGLAQLARALALHARGHRFESDTLHLHTSVAQLVEHWSPKPGVGGSSPPRRATTVSCSEMASHGVLAAGLEVRVLSGQLKVL